MREGEQRDFARRLRRDLTDAEQCIWYFLRNRALMGCKFRRQHPVGPYIADFACIEAGLIVELDGGQHAGSKADVARTAYLASGGYRVLRFWNDEVLTQAEAVLTVIHDALARRPALTPTPLPPAGEGLEEPAAT